jgi:hypothetical protein
MKVALIHDWLTGMRGGEKCLEVFCELFPEADVYTLFYLPDGVSPGIRSMKVRASWLNRLPGVGRPWLTAGLATLARRAKALIERRSDLKDLTARCRHSFTSQSAAGLDVATLRL